MFAFSVECEMGDAMTDSGVDSELSPSSPDSVTEARPGVTEMVTGRSAEELVARMEEEDEEKFVIDEGKMTGDPDKMETVEALLSLGGGSQGQGQEKPLITLLPAHSPDTGNIVKCALILKSRERL